MRQRRTISSRAGTAPRCCSGPGLIAEEQAPAAEQQARDLVAALEHRPRLREIAANPLLLTMIALVHQHRLRLPQQRA